MFNDSVLRRLYGRVPYLMKERAGSGVYDAFINLRRKLLNAKVGVCEGKRKISYFHIDGGHSQTILYFHGFADSKDTFYDAAHFLTDRFNIIAPDLPGFGKSDKRKDDAYTLDSFSDWMLDFMERMNISGCHLVGNSLGGAVAASVALKAPEKLATLTLVDPAAIYCEGRHSLHQELFDDTIIFDVRNEDEFEYFLDRVFYKRPFMPPPVKDFIYQEFHRHSMWHRRVLSDLFQGLSSEDDPLLWEIALNRKLPNIPTPTLLLWGDEDTLFPADTAYVAKDLLPNAKLHFFTDVGHCPQIESPRVFSRVLTKYLIGQTRRIEQERLHAQKHKFDPSEFSTEKKQKTNRKKNKVVKSSTKKSAKKSSMKSSEKAPKKKTKSSK